MSEKKLIGEYLAKLQAKAWLSHALCAPGQHTAKRRRKYTRQSRYNNNNNNNSHDNVYAAVIMTKVIARVHSVHLVNVD